MKVQFVKTLWGVTEEMGNHPDHYDQLFERIKACGFDGIETPISLIPDKTKFREALDRHGLFYIAMINTCTFPPEKPSCRVENHIASFRALVSSALEMKPIFINSHSGQDSFSFKDACCFFKEALDVEAEKGIQIYHETHRVWLFFYTLVFASPPSILAVII